MGMSKFRRIPGARWWIGQGQKLRTGAALDHSRAVAEHLESREPAAPEHPRNGPEAGRTRGSGGPARPN